MTYYQFITDLVFYKVCLYATINKENENDSKVIISVRMTYLLARSVHC